jgi:hypothetical protein
MWRVTTYGKLFAENKIDAPDKVFTYNGEVVGRSINMTKITSCFEYDFDYDEVFHTFNSFYSE